MLRRMLPVLSMLVLLALPEAARAASVADLARVLRFDQLFAILHEEGIAHGRDLESELFPGAGGARWQAIVAAIHDHARMEQAALSALQAELRDRPEAVERMVAFFEGEPGATIIGLEIAAREAFLDDTVKDAAELAHADMVARKDPRLALIDALVEANELIEMNVAGALNGNLAFYRGMADGGALPDSPPESEMMADLWAQEAQIRADTEAWLLPYLTLAYRPLGDADLEAYIAFSRTDEGRLLNRALFSAFDAVFNGLSRDLGLAAAQLLQGEDL